MLTEQFVRSKRTQYVEKMDAFNPFVRSHVLL